MTLTVDRTIPITSGLKLTVGSFTQTLNGADGSLALDGGQVYGAQFYNQDATSGTGKFLWANPRITVSVSGMIATVTIKCRELVTAGRFMIWHA